MKTLKVLMLVLLMPRILFAQPFPKVTYNPDNCSLSIKAGKWAKVGGKEILSITAVLSNNSKDTLKYASELCFNGEFGYLSDTTNFIIDREPEDCLKNWQITATLPPHSHKTEKLNLIRKYADKQRANLQLETTLSLVNIYIHQAMINVLLGQKDLKVFYDELSLYKKQNEHIFLSNVLKIQ